jgi:uncharacterized protein (UPF0276 family)
MDEIVMLEIIPENFFASLGTGPRRRLFREIERRGIPTILHCIALSLASIEPLKESYLREVLNVARELPTMRSLSDHLCMTERSGSEIGQLTTAPYTTATLDCITRKIEAIQARIDVPFAIENISHPFMVPADEMTETEFIRRLQARTGCGFLLDLHNIYTNAVNFGVDPYAYIAEVNLAAVDSIHLAGGFYDEHGMLQDGHCARVPERVWELFRHTIRRARRAIPTIVERTSKNAANGLQPVLDDQRMAQAILTAETAEERWGSAEVAQ